MERLKKYFLSSFFLSRNIPNAIIGMAQVLDQQEGEYETELQQLIAAAEAELHGERENTGKLRATLQVLRVLFRS